MTRKPATLVPFPASKPDFIASAMLGRMNPEDMAYMARAILQMSDENAELRERVRALELAFINMAGRK